MLLNAYTIYDTKALSYNAPFFFSTDGQAVRALQDLASDVNTMIGKHPRDFTLFRVGVFDTNKAELTGVVPFVHIVDAISLIPAQEPLFTNTTAQ